LLCASYRKLDEMGDNIFLDKANKMIYLNLNKVIITSL
jgi:hypothetical protein